MQAGGEDARRNGAAMFQLRIRDGQEPQTLHRPLRDARGECLGEPTRMRIFIQLTAMKTK